MATAQKLEFELGAELSCIHSVQIGEYFFTPFDEEQNEVLIRTVSGATSIVTGEQYPTELFEVEDEDEAEDDEYLLELVPAGRFTLEIA